MKSAVHAAASSFMSTHTTFAPSRAKAAAVALPLPHSPATAQPAPSTMAVFPCRRLAIVSPCSCSDAPVLARPVAFADVLLEHLADVAARQLIPHLDRFRRLHRTQPLAAKRQHLFHVPRSARLEFDDRLHG